MTPRHGEVWLVDMGMTAKTRPAVVLIADNLNAPRSAICHSSQWVKVKSRHGRTAAFHPECQLARVALAR